ncbi:hypothetical protein COB21_00610 [Candidatus Aerophobetes bacterium]|uniref:Uncharacterized protein n=1 Tax=Aerophobetes bacterium TaxID=2030807 RepID=A0A2A4X6W3_UNCAE|nr:MAG: hypothetical protein COB21_00610 [Candidatus Aerophobetes bacterium]
MKTSLLAAMLLLLAGCVPRQAAETTGVSSGKTTASIAVPLVKGDSQGEITAAIIRGLCNNSICWEYQPSSSGAEYTVHLTVISQEKDPIGYRYDREDFTKTKIDRLIQDEVRRTLVLQGVLYRRGEKKPAVEPFRIEGSCAYDYINSHALFDAAFVNDEGDLESVLEFSLGQLDALDGAEDASRNALFESAAQNFVQGLDHLYYQLKNP